MAKNQSKRPAETRVKQEARRQRAGSGKEGPVAQYEEPDLLALQRAVANPDIASPVDILALQRTVGNQAVQRLLNPAKRVVQRVNFAEVDTHGTYLPSRVSSGEEFVKELWQKMSGLTQFQQMASDPRCPKMFYVALHSTLAYNPEYVNQLFADKQFHRLTREVAHELQHWEDYGAKKFRPEFLRKAEEQREAVAVTQAKVQYLTTGEGMLAFREALGNYMEQPHEKRAYAVQFGMDPEPTGREEPGQWEGLWRVRKKAYIDGEDSNLSLMRAQTIAGNFSNVPDHIVKLILEFAR